MSIWVLSTGLSETLTTKKSIIAANKSIIEWITFEIILTEPVGVPTTIFSVIRTVFDAIDIETTF